MNRNSQDQLLTGEARDQAAIRSVMEAVAHGADLRQWLAVQAAFATPVELDYGTPEHLTREQVVARWRPLLGAFDATRHEVTDVAVCIEGDSATASSRFEATHLLRGVANGEVWTLAGSYEHAFVRTSEGWVITRMRMIPEQSTGNASLLDEARARAGMPLGPS
jgi:uncharacterized protein